MQRRSLLANWWHAEQGSHREINNPLGFTHSFGSQKKMAQFTSAWTTARLMTSRVKMRIHYHKSILNAIRFLDRTLLSMLASWGTQDTQEWGGYLRPLCMAYNSSVNPTTGYTPISFMFGYQIRMPILYGQPTESECSQAYAAALRSRLELAFKYVRQQMGHQLHMYVRKNSTTGKFTVVSKNAGKKLQVCQCKRNETPGKGGWKWFLTAMRLPRSLITRYVKWKAVTISNC